MSQNGKASVFVYGLCAPDPAGLQVQYVGCTGQHLHNRLQAHLNEAITVSAETPKLEWLRELLRNNQEPCVVLLEQVRDGVDWQAREQWWITFFGRGNLLNGTAGGIGAKELASEVRERISVKNRGRKQTPEHREAIRRANLGRKHTDEARQSISKTRRERIASGVIAMPKGGTVAAAKKLAGSIWINDGSTNRRIAKTEKIPHGWEPGRK